MGASIGRGGHAETPAPSLSVTLLGLVSAHVGDTAVTLHGTLGRTTLAVLALAADRPVPAARFVTALWGDDPPGTARQQVQNQVSRLRVALRDAGAPDVLRSDAAGYRLAVDAGAVDLGAARRLHVCAAAERARGELDRAVELLGSALATWSGPPLSGVTEHLALDARPAVDELRLAVVTDRVTAELDAGRADAAVLALRSLLREHPLQESLHHLLILALHRAGRRADALDAYRGADRVLRDELGIDPSPELRRLHQEILTGDGPPREPAAPARAVGTPAELPRRSAVFVGREDELARLTTLLSRPADRPPVAVVTGMAGAGKTALAVEAAAAVTAAFPDGQLYVDLRGTDDRPADPLTVLGALLRSLGVDSGSQPGDVAGRAAEFRTRTARSRLLVLLDNAADEAQVDALLPNGGGCATLVTSRSTLPRLEATARVAVGPAPPDVARRLLAAATDRDLAPWPAAVDAIVAACGGVPLALRIAAARLSTSPELSVASLGRRLTDDPVAGLAVGDDSVRGAVAATVDRLAPAPAAALRAVAALDVPVFAPWLAAPLLGVTDAAAERLLGTLASVHLIEPLAADGELDGCYRFHDLVRACVAGAAPADPGAADARRRAVARTVWLVGVARAAIVPAPSARSGPWPAAVDAELARRLGVTPPVVLAADGPSDPAAWTARHWPTVLAMVDVAAALGDTGQAAALLTVATEPLLGLDLLDEFGAAADRLLAVAGDDAWVAAAATVARARALRQRADHRAVVELCEASPVGGLDDRTRLAVWLTHGSALAMCERFEPAVDVLGRALALADELDDGRARSSAHIALAGLRRGRGEHDAASAHAEQAVEWADRGGASAKERALARYALAIVRLAGNRPADALRLVGEAVELVRGVGDQVGESWCLMLRAQAARALGDLDGAAHAVARSLTLARRLRRPEAEATAERTLGELLLENGDIDGAVAAATRALALIGSFDSPVERRKLLVLLRALRRE